MSRIVYLDIAKAICMILVVIGHYSPMTAPEYWQQLIRVIYTFHMPLFMFTSGLIYILSKNTPPRCYKRFVVKKTHRLAIPYIAVSIILITVKIFLGKNGENVDLPCDIYSYFELFYRPAAGFFLWFLYVLYVIFLIVPLFKTKKSRLYLALASLILYFIPIDLPHEFCLFEFKNHFCFFMCGVLCGECKDIIKIQGKSLLIPLLLLAVNVFATIWGYSNMGVVKMLLALNGIFCMLSISRYIENHWSSALTNIIMASFTIYLFHTAFEGFTKSIVYRVAEFVPLPFILQAVVIVVGGIILPVWLDKFVLRKYRVTRYLFGLK